MSIKGLKGRFIMENKITFYGFNNSIIRTIKEDKNGNKYFNYDNCKWLLTSEKENSYIAINEKFINMSMLVFKIKEN